MRQALPTLTPVLPVLGDTAVPEEAVTGVVEALAARGAPEALVRRLLQGYPVWGAADWWFDDDEQSWPCEGDHSPRKVPLGDPLSSQQRDALEGCLTPH